MTWDFSTDPDFQKQLDWMNDFVRAEVWPLETLDLPWPDLRRAIAPLRERVKARGLWAAHLGPEHGGQGFGQVKLGLMHEILGTSPFGPLVFGNQAPDSGNAEILARSGTAEQKRRWLAPLLDGDMYSAFAMTEWDTAGADPTRLETTAVRVGEDWVVNGRKWFISNAQIADFFIVTAVTDPHAPRHSGTSQLIIPAGTPGVTIVRAFGSMEELRLRDGEYPSHAEMTFTGARVPAGALLGEQGAGFAVAQQRLGPGRIHHCMRWLGQARRGIRHDVRALDLPLRARQPARREGDGT